MKHTLPEFILLTGDKESAELFGVEERTAASWRRKERFPRPFKAKQIIEITKDHKYGPIELDGIYPAA